MADLGHMTVAELCALADELGVQVPPDAKKDDIIDALKGPVAEAEAAKAKPTKEQEPVTVWVDRDGNAIVRGEKRHIGRALAGAEVTL